MAAPVEAFGVTVKADFRDFERQMLRARNETDAKLAAMEKRFARANQEVKAQTDRLATSARSGFGGLNNAITSAGAGLPGLGSGFNLAGAAAGAAAIGVTALVASLQGVKNAAQFADDLATAADRIGVTSEALQGLRYAADETDVPLQNLEQGLEALNASLGAFKTGIGAKRITPVFEALGLRPEDVAHIDNAADLLPILADRLGQVSDRATQVQLAKKLGIENLLPLLRRGSTGIADMTNEARSLGLVMSEDVVKGLADTSRELERNKQVIDANVREMQNALAPFFVWASNQLANLARGFSDLLNQGASVEGRRDLVLERQEATLTRQVDMARRQARGGRLTAVQQGWVRQLAEVQAERRRRAQQQPTVPSASQRAREGGYQVDLPPRSGGGGGRSRGGGRDTAAREAERAAQEALHRQRRFDDDLAQASERNMQAQSQLALTAEQRASIAIQLLDSERQQRRVQLDRAVTDGDMTAAQRDQLLAAEEGAWIAKAANVAATLLAGQQAEQADAERQMTDFTVALLRLRSGQARTAGERRALELQLLDIHQKERRLALERVLADEQATEAQKKIAKALLDRLGEMEGSERKGVEGANQSPMQAWFAEGIGSAAEMNEALERVAASGLDSLNEGLVDAIMGARSLGDVFKAVANQIIADLLRIAVRQAVTEPLARLGSAMFRSIPIPGIPNLPGFANGGSFAVGGVGGIDSQLVAFRATPGEMVDIRKPGQDMGGQGMILHVQASPWFDVRAQKVAAPVAEAAARRGAAGAVGFVQATSDEVQRGHHMMKG